MVWEWYDARPRLCDLGYLRVPYLRPNGTVGYRWPGEPVHTYLRKGGEAADTVGRACLCNALLANIGLGQTRRIGGYAEDPLVTLGSDLGGVQAMLQHYPDGWSAAQAVSWLVASSPSAAAAVEGAVKHDLSGQALSGDPPAGRGASHTRR